MKLRRRLTTVAMLALALTALGGGALVGARLGREASAPRVRNVAIAAPEGFAGPATGARRSAAGFTGFGGKPALGGDVLRAGTLESVNGGNLVIATAESALTVRASGTERLYTIGASNPPLRPGESVQVLVRDGAVTGVLRLPPGVGQGGNR